jgi:hypothetical protein
LPFQKSARANARRRNGVRGALWLIVHARYVGGIATTVKVTSARIPRRAADAESTANNVFGLLDVKLSPTAWPRSRNIWINACPITVIFHRQSRAFCNGNSPTFSSRNLTFDLPTSLLRGSSVPACRSLTSKAMVVAAHDRSQHFSSSVKGQRILGLA